jgi:hypothetical protein
MITDDIPAFLRLARCRTLVANDHKGKRAPAARDKVAKATGKEGAGGGTSGKPAVRSGAVLVQSSLPSTAQLNDLAP